MYKSFEAFSDRFGSFSHNYLRLFGVVVVAVLLSASSLMDRSKRNLKRIQFVFEKNLKTIIFFDTLILHVGVESIQVAGFSKSLLELVQ